MKLENYHWKIFLIQKKKRLSTPDWLMLYGKVGMNFLSTFELPYPNTNIEIRHMEARPIFYLISDNHKVSFRIKDCSLYPRRFVLQEINGEKR